MDLVEPLIPVVNGSLFWADPWKYIRGEAPWRYTEPRENVYIQFYMGGFMTDCNVDRFRVARELNGCSLFNENK